MAKTYTAQQMRDVAQCLHYNSPTKLTIEAAAMLRQAADFMEREEKRKKKYEYALKESNGTISFRHFDDIDSLGCDYRAEEYTAMRREVGKWEEVANG